MKKEIFRKGDGEVDFMDLSLEALIIVGALCLLFGFVGYLAGNFPVNNIQDNLNSCAQENTLLKSQISGCTNETYLNYSTVIFFTIRHVNVTKDNETSIVGCPLCDRMMPMINRLSYCYKFEYRDLSTDNESNWDIWSKDQIDKYKLHDLPAFVCPALNGTFAKTEGISFENELRDWIENNCKKECGGASCIKQSDRFKL